MQNQTFSPFLWDAAIVELRPNDIADMFNAQSIRAAKLDLQQRLLYDANGAGVHVFPRVTTLVFELQQNSGTTDILGHSNDARSQAVRRGADSQYNFATWVECQKCHVCNRYIGQRRSWPAACAVRRFGGILHVPL